MDRGRNFGVRAMGGTKSALAKVEKTDPTASSTAEATLPPKRSTLLRGRLMAP